MRGQCACNGALTILTTPNERRILIIAPHADDETIGCGGTMALESGRGAAVDVVVMAMGGIRHHHHADAVPLSIRMAEFQAAARHLGVATTRVLFPGSDMRLEDVRMLDLVSSLDEILRHTAYDDCYIPEQSHNLDHRRTYEAAMAALRPCGRKPLSLVAAYESTVTWWQSGPESGSASYVDVGSTLNEKLAALAEYKTQMREYPHPVSAEGVRRLAAMRGMECGIEFAERFRVIRQVHR